MSHLTETFIHASLYQIRWCRLEPDDRSSTTASIILNHGTPFNSHVWLPYALALRQKYVVYLWDLPGFGESQGTTDPSVEDPDVSYDIHGQAFAALYLHWSFSDSNRPHVIAHDIGGHAALRARVLLGIKYASLCLFDPVALRPWGSPFMRSMMSHGEVFETVPEGVFRGMVRSYVQSAAVKPLSEDVMGILIGPWTERGLEGRKAFLRQARHAKLEHTAQQDALYQGVFREEGEGDRLKIVWANEDAWIPVERGEKLAQLTNAVEFVRIDNAGHLVLLDQPERVMYEILTWLAKMVEIS